MALVLVTGGTGFIGGATVARLLADSRVEEIHLLVRARDPVEAYARAAQSIARFGIACVPPKRLRVILGSLADFILPPDVRGRITHVLHAAAHTSFRSVRTSRETNVEGTKALVRAVAGSPKLERFLFVGTAYRLGVANVGIVEEDSGSSEEHLVEYTRTKAEAESELETVEGLPWVVARPSIVVGHTTLGVAPSASLFWYYRALAKAGISPFSPTRRRDIVPVDWVADCLVQLLLKPHLRHSRYHLSAGEGSAETWAAIHGKFGACGEAAALSDWVELQNLRAHPAWNRVALSAWTLDAIAACAQFSKLPYDVFSNRKVLTEGVSPPPRFTSYLARCLNSSSATVEQQAGGDV